MIEAVPKSTFSQDFILSSPNGGLAELDVSGWRERAEFELDGVPYRLYRESALGDFVLERAGAVIARATKPSAFRSTFQLQVSGHDLTLRKTSAWRRDFGVFDGEEMVGRIAPVKWYGRRAYVELPGDWNLALQLFLFWLVLLMWRRQNAAAAST
jgi:hypothetical protein